MSSTAKKQYICQSGHDSSQTTEPQDSVEKAYSTWVDYYGDPDDFDDLHFYELTEIQVEREIKLVVIPKKVS